MTRAEILASITPEYVNERVNSLSGEFGDRNTTMDEMEEFYRLEMWEGEKPPDEQRFNSPRPFSVVETQRSLLFVRRPLLQVPKSKVGRVESDMADAMEKMLYGAWQRMGLGHVIHEAEWYATCLGSSVIKVVYDDTLPDEEFPIIAQAIDPRVCYWHEDPRRPLHDSEFAVSFDRVRRDIELEWGELPSVQEPGEARDQWLDEKVKYHEYWATYVIEEEEEIEPAQPETGIPAEEEAAPEIPTVRRFIEGLARLLPGRKAPALEEAARSADESAQPEEEREPERLTRTVKRRIVINCVVAEEVFVKEPVVMPGYERIPFFRWSGIHTPMSGEFRSLSVLFPIVGGTREKESQGLVSLENQLLAFSARLVEQRASAAFITDDETMPPLDARPGAMNYIKQGREWQYAVPPGESPDLGRAMQRAEELAEDATMPGTMFGRFQAVASGVALDIMTNPVLMRASPRQQQREDQLRELNSTILALYEQYAPERGWTVWGRDKGDEPFEVRLDPNQIHGYRRNRVTLMAQLPRDAAGLGMILSQAVDRKMISLETAMEAMQNALNLPNKSVSDEMKQILVESILFGNEDVNKAMALEALKEYDQALAAAAEAVSKAREMPPPGQPGGMGGPIGGPRPGPGGPGPGPSGPMMGMPPQQMPPQMMPEAVGVRDPVAMQNMMRGGPGRPPMPPGAMGGPRGA